MKRKGSRVVVTAFRREAGALVLDPACPPLTRDTYCLVLAKTGVYTFFRARRVCRKWKEMIDTLMANMPSWFAREIPRFLGQMAQHYKTHGGLLNNPGVRQYVMGGVTRLAIHDYYQAPVVNNVTYLPHVLHAKLGSTCFCQKPLVSHVCQQCNGSTLCKCFDPSVYDAFGHITSVSILPRCCVDPLCCFYVEFMQSYGVCVCGEVRFERTCPGRHLSSYFPWERRFDHRPGERLHDVRQMDVSDPDPQKWTFIDRDKELLPFCGAYPNISTRDVSLEQ
jgi:hypothetical protein